jgi:hypothetical protein
MPKLAINMLFALSISGYALCTLKGSTPGEKNKMKNT